METTKKKDEASLNLRIAHFSEVNSSNLGDPIIQETLMYLLRRAGADPDLITSFDMSGRPSSSKFNSEKTKTPESILKRIARKIPAPPRLKMIAAWMLKKKRRNVREWEDVIKTSDLVLIGGGQLVMDNSLNFPLSLNLISNLCVRHAVPYHIVAVGCSSDWTYFGARLIAPVIARAKSIAVRDKMSGENIKRFLDRNQRVAVIGDPALWSSDFYQIPKKYYPVGDRPHIGIGVTAPDTLRRYDSKITSSETLCYLTDTAAALLARGARVSFFTNGDVDDQSTINGISKVVPDADVVPRPKSPSNLVETIASFDAVVAHRLHANIVATSLGIPAFGMSWDKKVPSFFREINRPSFGLVALPDPEVLAEMLLKATKERVDEEPEFAITSSKKRTFDYLHGIVVSGTIK